MIAIETKVKSPVSRVWEYWSNPEHVTKWCAASEDWHAPRATNDLKTGGKFMTRMEAKDGSFGFDFAGVYDAVVEHELIEYTLEDERRVITEFGSIGDETQVKQKFDPESENSEEMQRDGWQSILDSFKKYVESRE